MRKIILLGCGGHAVSCVDVIEAEGKFKIIGFVDQNVTKDSKFMNYPIIGSDKELMKIKKECEYAFIAIGQIKNSKIRENRFKELVSLGFKIPFIISPNAYVSSKSNIEAGTIIMHNAIINANAKIGKNCIINSRSLIEHDVRVEENCHISTGAILNGEVKIGRNTFIGSGSILKEKISVGENCIVGAGSTILKDIKSNSLYQNEK